MIKKISLLLGLIAALPASSFAWVGGPFDGGTHGQLLDDRGIYQAAFRMKNGSGFMQFGVNVDLGPSINTATTGSSTALSTTIGSYLNRSIVYYKGVTFFGNATGFVDHATRSVSGFTNAQSEVTLSASTTGDDGDLSATNSIVSNGLGLTANIAWTADITSTHPELTFEGTGELVIINPSAEQVIYQGIVSIIEDYTPPPNSSLGDLIGDLVNQLGTLQDAVPSADGVYQNSEKVDITVYGARKFFLTRR
ncbi:hypothetical protein FEM03_04435 [Phragmitibacter flavus]|uniref:Uncharacterized protein n=1 Tax=Phragmitibacter flavus TaxID=2576071 RepID=A0A5R8KI95_9BACT|nr:hypothetical protein [Phragmitibacter flavus]TLD71977.1 hypothetical protein FEM03_04435 [Phragmitibacter flavus]